MYIRIYIYTHNGLTNVFNHCQVKSMRSSYPLLAPDAHQLIPQALTVHLAQLGQPGHPVVVSVKRGRGNPKKYMRKIMKNLCGKKGKYA
jgi:hypothetical protein